MGKRKSSCKPKVTKKKLPKLDTSFQCPFCNYPDSVTVDIVRKPKLHAVVQCRICKESYVTDRIDNLSAEIDYYTEWIDECERVNK